MQGCMCLKINAFPNVLQTFWHSQGLLPATASIACWWGAFALKSVPLHMFCKHFGSHWGCIHRMLPGCVSLQIHASQFVLQNFGSHWGDVCDRAHRMLLGCVCLKSNAFPLVLKACWLSLWVLSAIASIACCWVRVSKNQCLSSYLTSVLALSGGAV